MEVSVRPWSADDLALLVRLMGDPAMTEHLGGPESEEKIRARLERYMDIEGSGRGKMFVIVAGPDAEPVGSIGYWEREWRGDTVWETGWSVVPELQGRGIATKAVALTLQEARREPTHRAIHAFPSIDNGASNALCRNIGFRLLGEHDFEYPPGNPLRCNDWVIETEDPS
jgi:RimJ/RimL family protein N-acetyltransferase